MRRLLPSVIAVLAGLILLGLNLAVATSELQLHLDGARTVMTVERCAHNACSGSYALGGTTYHDRLLLGQGRLGERVTVLVDRGHPGDASTTGWGAAIEACLLAVAGALIAGVAGRRAWRKRGAVSSLEARARVWDVPESAEGNVEGER
jgi:hypothetical protein